MLCYDGHHDSTFLKVASVVCKELGYGPPGIAQIDSYGFLYGENFLGFNSAWCRVDVAEVLDCSLEGSYYPRFDRCLFSKVLEVGCLPAEAEEYDVALLANFQYTEGVVLIHINGQWGPICRGRAGDAVCRELGLGPEHGSFHGGIISYAPPVLGSLYCDNHNGTVEECSMTSVIDSPCDADTYLTVSCNKTDNSHEDDYDDLFPSAGLFTPYLSFIVVIILGIGLSLLVCHVKRTKAQQRHHNPVGATAIPSLSSTVNQQHRPSPHHFAFNHCRSRQRERSSVFQAFPPSETQEADPAPPYPSTEYQSPDIPPYPPPLYDDSDDLPRYEEVVRNQIPYSSGRVREVFSERGL
ncbi:Lysyl oxidase-like 4 [Holothuria leucospilota]|uniref:Lysyl oxidase-like 4 n=1 Tax=Holothuria leucospilota TaxID=206669 RepID=A0A9Q1BKM4_HOLLE|nr:Lysyl oxidase-like 4 [Holothuria leucospilota]